MTKQTAAPAEWRRRPHIKPLYRNTDEKAAKDRPDDRADAAEAKLPSGAVGTQRCRIHQRANNIDPRLNAEHEEAREEGRNQQCRLRGGAA